MTDLQKTTRSDPVRFDQFIDPIGTLHKDEHKIECFNFAIIIIYLPWLFLLTNHFGIRVSGRKPLKTKEFRIVHACLRFSQLRMTAIIWSWLSVVPIKSWCWSISAPGSLLSSKQVAAEIKLNDNVW